MTVTEANDSAVARKRRKQIIQSQRSELEQLTEASTALPAPSADTVGNPNNEGASTAKLAKRKAPAEAAVAADPGTKQQQELSSSQPQNGETSASLPPPLGKKSKATKKTQAGGNAGSITTEQQEQDEAKKKAQIRYDPDVPMSKEQLAAWRREARRVRNRESAAASRARIRSRITELEDEVGEWKTKYAQAMSRLQNLEKNESNGV